jgi:hypothetical protein
MSLDRGGFSPRPRVWSISWIAPHFYNSHAEVERVVAALKRYLTTGL